MQVIYTGTEPKSYRFCDVKPNGVYPMSEELFQQLVRQGEPFKEVKGIPPVNQPPDEPKEKVAAASTAKTPKEKKET
ncbi:MAG: hypothetical protein KJ970_13185 [Candidatus Eisenbacteria bacterium]|uniref:Uncharacterized protein n=1 Tax=Eiseniibacteriota bacterium TaxID=2212470 RepID=A0A948WDH6_UNCEI|nr:hypothetical protein [Candidatus Eisenbacteria bacterium]MBU1949959.1 hypothetical protein [Candidatus Eisenbacteria bacterium]MBU2691868.1 hypothetical protein [Candidatus Eisenbacteria bacterium]